VPPRSSLGLVTDGPAVTGWREVVEREASSGGRLLLLARATKPDAWLPTAVVAFADPLREHIAEAVALARDAGIQTVVVTGDHPGDRGCHRPEAGIDPQQIVVGPDLAVGRTTSSPATFQGCPSWRELSRRTSCASWTWHGAPAGRSR
jgi:nicotinamidase-related amidase